MINFVIVALFALIVGAFCLIFFLIGITTYKNRRANSNRRAFENQFDLFSSNQTTILNPKDARKDRDFNAKPGLTNGETTISPVSRKIMRSSEANVSPRAFLASKTQNSNANEISRETMFDPYNMEVSRKLETMLRKMDRENRNKQLKKIMKISACLLVIATIWIFLGFIARVLITIGAILIGMGILCLFIHEFGNGIKALLLGAILCYIGTFFYGLMGG